MGSVETWGGEDRRLVWTLPGLRGDVGIITKRLWFWAWSWWMWGKGSIQWKCWRGLLFQCLSRTSRRWWARVVVCCLLGSRLWWSAGLELRNRVPPSFRRGWRREGGGRKWLLNVLVLDVVGRVLVGQCQGLWRQGTTEERLRSPLKFWMLLCQTSIPKLSVQPRT